MGFGLVLRRWVATLHRRATACFMLHSLLLDQEEFSICQGDPAASVFFTIYIEPFLACLERLLRGLFMGGLCEATLSYMDDVNELGEDEQDILITDELCRAFEAASGAILNRNRKTVILGLILSAREGGGAGCKGKEAFTRIEGTKPVFPQFVIL